jgi:hypothetical protein
MARPLDALRDTQREWMINRSRLIACARRHFCVATHSGLSLLLVADYAA